MSKQFVILYGCYFTTDFATKHEKNVFLYFIEEKMKLDEGIGDEPELDRSEFNGIIGIEVEKGPKKSHRDRLETLDKVMAAWNAKRELLVTFRELSEIYKGMVGLFLPSGLNVEPILEYLKKNPNAKVRLFTFSLPPFILPH